MADSGSLMTIDRHGVVTIQVGNPVRYRVARFLNDHIVLYREERQAVPCPLWMRLDEKATTEQGESCDSSFFAKNDVISVLSVRLLRDKTDDSRTWPVDDPREGETRTRVVVDWRVHQFRLSRLLNRRLDVQMQVVGIEKPTSGLQSCKLFEDGATYAQKMSVLSFANRDEGDQLKVGDVVLSDLAEQPSDPHQPGIAYAQQYPSVQVFRPVDDEDSVIQQLKENDPKQWTPTNVRLLPEETWEKFADARQEEHLQAVSLALCCQMYSDAHNEQRAAHNAQIFYDGSTTTFKSGYFQYVPLDNGSADAVRRRPAFRRKAPLRFLIENPAGNDHEPLIVEGTITALQQLTANDLNRAPAGSAKVFFQLPSKAISYLAVNRSLGFRFARMQVVASDWQVRKLRDFFRDGKKYKALFDAPLGSGLRTVVDILSGGAMADWPITTDNDVEGFSIDFPQQKFTLKRDVDQLKIVFAIAEREEPVVFVDAAAGSGKTLVAAMSIQAVIEKAEAGGLSKGKAPAAVYLASTVSNTAADELANALDRLSTSPNLRIVRLMPESVETAGISVRHELTITWQLRHLKDIATVPLSDEELKWIEDGEVIEDAVKQLQVSSTQKDQVVAQLPGLQKALDVNNAKLLAEVYLAKYRPNIIITTISSASNPIVQAAKVTKILIDEAGQVRSADIFQLLSTVNPDRFTGISFFGDPKQLPPFNQHVDGRLGRTVLSSPYDVQARLPAPCVQMLQLTNCYRMHDALINFSNFHTYHDRMRSALEPGTRDALLKIFPFPQRECPIFFVNVEGAEEPSLGTSRVNRLEARVAAVLADAFARLGVDEGKICLLAPYAGQCSELKEQATLLQRFLVDAATIDSSQGDEWDLVITSTTRSLSNTKAVGSALGFLADDRRGNVSLTRAKFGQIVVCNVATLESGEEGDDHFWRRALAYARKEKLIVDLAYVNTILMNFGQIEQKNLDFFYREQGGRSVFNLDKLSPLLPQLRVAPPTGANALKRPRQFFQPQQARLMPLMPGMRPIQRPLRQRQPAVSYGDIPTIRPSYANVVARRETAAVPSAFSSVPDVQQQAMASGVTPLMIARQVQMIKEQEERRAFAQRQAAQFECVTPMHEAAALSDDVLAAQLGAVHVHSPSASLSSTAVLGGEGSVGDLAEYFDANAEMAVLGLFGQQPPPPPPAQDEKGEGSAMEQ